LLRLARGNIRIEPFDVFDLSAITLGKETEQTFTMRDSRSLQAAWSVNLDPGLFTLQEDGVL
jgi:hypothetical protein